ncbi:uncharacterized protein [Palaemon carinicauda]|uniref:uncharacterized protein n=1 Tax=Palaemon carinicauda TaxID=392227 RepID=UPI0035B61C55
MPPSLVAANGSPIRCYGARILRISILGRSYSWPFAIVDVSRPLLGADFLAHHRLLVDVTGKRLIDTGTCRSRALRAGPATMSVSAVMTQPYADILQEFPDVFKPELRQSPGSPSKHWIYHHIMTTGPPTHAKFRRLPPQKLRDAKRAFEDMERMGIWSDLPTPNRYHPGYLPFCVGYVDNILIFSRTKEEHRRHVRAILKRLQENGLVVRFDKCTFGAEGVDFLGHCVSSSGVKKLEWGSPQQHAFTRTKDALANTTTLAYFDDNAPLRLTTDASNVACGAVLEQLIDGSPRSLAFFSRKLKPAKTKYSTFDRELLAVYLAVRHFRHILEGTPFTIATDHQPLIHAFIESTDAWSS